MSFLVKVEGSESFEVAKECVRSVKVTTDIPLDSNARTKDVGATMVITGKLGLHPGRKPIPARRLFPWPFQLPEPKPPVLPGWEKQR